MRLQNIHTQHTHLANIEVDEPGGFVRYEATEVPSNHAVPSVSRHNFVTHATYGARVQQGHHLLLRNDHNKRCRGTEEHRGACRGYGDAELCMQAAAGNINGIRRITYTAGYNVSKFFLIAEAIACRRTRTERRFNGPTTRLSSWNTRGNAAAQRGFMSDHP
jgi:hypothetical protein